jgi:signal transduction histidine kinase
VRAERGRVLGGVAAGIGDSLGADPTLVRLVFALLSFAGGAGIVLYAAGWLLLPLEGDREPSRRRRAFGFAALVVAASLAASGLGLSDSIVWPAALVALGVAVYRSAGLGLRIPPVVGAVLAIAGVAIFVGQNGAGGGGSPLLAPGAVALGLLIVVGPWLWRLARERDDERDQRVRSEERAELAARVHDSVLQTLALIQREAGDPRRVASLARRQERELRAWLYPDGTRVEGESLSSALEAAATEIEELHGVRVELVRSGDCPLDDRVDALVLAAREAMANAARHSGTDEVSVFAEASDGDVVVYVRDRGAGFDPAAVPADRRGLAQSIRGRLERAGGTATVTAAPGEGAEIELRVPASRRRLDGADPGAQAAAPPAPEREQP